MGFPIDERRSGQFPKPPFRIDRVVEEVPEPPTLSERIVGAAKMTRRAMTSQVAAATAGGTIVGIAGGIGIGLSKGVLLTPDTRDRGRRVVWQQKEEDIRAHLQDELPKLHNSPEVWVGPYRKSPDNSFILSSVSSRRYKDNGNFFLSEPNPAKPSEFYFVNSRFMSGFGSSTIPQAIYEQVDGQKIDAYSDSNFKLLMQGSTGGANIEFFDFESLSGFYGQPDLGYMAALIPLEGSKVSSTVGERFVFAFQRQKANQVWIPNPFINAHEVEKNVVDPITHRVTQGERYIFVGWETSDPKKPSPINIITRNGIPVTPFQSPPYDALAFVITDKKGQVIQSAQINTLSWGTPGYLEGLTVTTAKEVPVKRIR